MKRNWKETIDPVIPDLSDDYFESISLKNAVWQYLIDHSKPIDGNMARIVFYITTESEFWRRVRARKEGKFRRKDFYEFNRKMIKRDRMISEMFAEKRSSDERSRKIQEFIKTGTFSQRFFLRLASFFKGVSKYFYEKVYEK